MSQPSAITIVWDIVLVLDHEQQQAGRSVRHSAQWAKGQIMSECIHEIFDFPK